jgi:pilus assembly protein CpaD
MSISAPLNILERLLRPAKLSGPIVVCTASLLTGCGSADRTATSSIPMDDYRVRHPIVLAETSRTLDLFPSSEMRGLDHRSAVQVRDFAHEYLARGHGPITIIVPTIGQDYARSDISGIRAAFASAGVSAQLLVRSYRVVNPSLASPIRLSFQGMKAEIPHRCGQWPSDLASGSSIDGWENKPYWNAGCATQAALAAEVADPRDLVAPAGDDPADTPMRTRAIEAVRKGTDPVTTWTTKADSISSIGSN